MSLRAADKKAAELATILKVLQFKIENLERLDIEELGISLGADEASRYDLIELYISDLVYDKFKLEAEDMEHSIEQLSSDDKKKVIEHEEKIFDLMNTLI